MWNPNPLNSVKFRADTMALFFDHDNDFPGFVVICVLARASTAVEWQNVGTVATGSWWDHVINAGGWANWVPHIRNVANGAIHAHLGDASPLPPQDPLPPGIPTTFDECKAWMVANIYAIDEPTKSNLYLGSKPQEPEVPEPAPGGFAANRVFDVGKQRLCLHLEVAANGESTVSFQRQVGNGWQRVAVA